MSDEREWSQTWMLAVHSLIERHRQEFDELVAEAGAEGKPGETTELPKSALPYVEGSDTDELIKETDARLARLKKVYVEDRETHLPTHPET